MAEEGMEKRIIVVPLKKIRDVPRTSRANLAIKEIRRHVAKHMKARDSLDDEDIEKGVKPEDKVWIDAKVNEAIWARGREKPPVKITVKVVKFEDGLIEVSLPEEA
ncbi:MAG: 50S ribosomal protein L31e [Euryarchaeota archaeon]|nr:50S ribosomal protein L31e [Euryarchaeota archaeon]